jgi:hypothetical protein
MLEKHERAIIEQSQTHATLDTRHRTKTNKIKRLITRTPTKNVTYALGDSLSLTKIAYYHKYE